MELADVTKVKCSFINSSKTPIWQLAPVIVINYFTLYEHDVFISRNEIFSRISKTWSLFPVEKVA